MEGDRAASFCELAVHRGVGGVERGGESHSDPLELIGFGGVGFGRDGKDYPRWHRRQWGRV